MPNEQGAADGVKQVVPPGPEPPENGGTAADAAVVASRDAKAAAQKATATEVAGRQAAAASAETAARAREVTAATVAAAAEATARTAARAAATVEAESAAQAVQAAAAAVEALEAMAAEEPRDGNGIAARRAAAKVAAAVAAEVVSRAQSATEAATTVAAAVAAAASDSAEAAARAARTVELAAGEAAAAGGRSAAASLDTAVATNIVVTSTDRVANLTARLRLLNALSDSEDHFALMFEFAALGMMLVSIEADGDRLLQVNPALVDLTGRSAEQLLTMRTSHLVHPDGEQPPTTVMPTSGTRGALSKAVVQRWAHADGSELWVRTRAHSVGRSVPSVLHAVGVAGPAASHAIVQVEDITARRRAEAFRREQAQRFRLAFDNALTGIAFLNLDGRLQRGNPALFSLLGRTPDDLVGRHLWTAVCEREQVELRQGLAEVAAGRVLTYQAEHRLGEAPASSWGTLNGTLVPDDDGRPGYLAVQVKDVTQRRLAEAQLARQALHDDLTDLPNRALLRDHLEQARSRAQRAGTYLAVLFLDLDDFKEINDSLGHVAGDQVLIEVTARLRACLRSGDTAARPGGDEFVVICEELGDPAEAIVVADRITQALKPPVIVAGTRVRVSASIGIITDDGTASVEELLRGADTAMYRAKRDGKDHHEVYEPLMRVDALRRIGLAAELEVALANDQLRLRYQLQFDLRTGAPVGVEALIRWEHPERGLLSPSEFLDVAEGRRLMIPIGDWVLRKAIALAGHWRTVFGDSSPVMWVNIAGQQLGRHEHLVALIQGALADAELPAGSVGLEITERQLIGTDDRVRDELLTLRGLGLRLAVDDFGTGYASLEYLRRFAFDEIKIDQSFVQGMGEDRVDRALTASIIDLARSLDLVVVAEGVETQAQHDTLCELKCTVAQGFLGHRPASAEDVERVLAAALAAAP